MPARQFLRLFFLCSALPLLLFYSAIVGQLSDDDKKYQTTLDYMTVPDALISVVMFQIIASVINVIFIVSSNVCIRIIRCIIGHLIGIILFTLIIYCCGGTFFVTTWKWNELSYSIYILSNLLSSLTFMPLFIKCSFDMDNLRMVIMDVKHLPNLSNNTVFSFPFWATIIGCICGCYILALDWFKPYQQFPLPCLIGACCGHLIGCSLLFVWSMCCANSFNARKTE